MPKIRILGADYKSAFEGARRIIKSGMLAEEMPGCYVDADGCINNGNNSFEFIDGNVFQNEIPESDFKITNDGANWFAPVRNFSNSTAAGSLSQGAHLWEEFLSDISRKYHDKFFLVACKKKSNEARDEERIRASFEKYYLYTQNVMKNFYPEITDWEFSPVFDENNSEDIYGLSLRLQIGTGGEKEIPVLGTLYLKQHSKLRMMPLSVENAKRIEQNLDDISDDDEYSNHLNRDLDSTSNALNTLFSEFSRIMSEDKSGELLADCIHFDKADERNLRTLLSRIQNDNKTLVCKQVEILGISHVSWEKQTFIVSEKNSSKEMFAVIAGVDETLLMLCLGCDEEGEIILGNRIATTDSETNESRIYSINPDLSNLGLSEKDIEYIRRNSKVSSHHLAVGALCGMPRNENRCRRIRCKSQLVTLKTQRGECRFCADCHYPEVVFRTNDSQLYYTPDLLFNADSIQLEPADRISKKPCACCGRHVTELKNDLYCRLCATAFSSDAAVLKVGVENYKKYRSIFPLQKRLSSSKKIKLCFEDAELLLFVLGEDKYIFHKLWLDNDGYLPSPVKVTT